MKIIPINQQFRCFDCQYTLTVSWKNIRRAKKYGGVYCPKCGKRIMENKWKEGK